MTYSGDAGTPERAAHIEDHPSPWACTEHIMNTDDLHCQKGRDIWAGLGSLSRLSVWEAQGEYVASGFSFNICACANALPSLYQTYSHHYHNAVLYNFVCPLRPYPFGSSPPRRTLKPFNAQLLVDYPLQSKWHPPSHLIFFLEPSDHTAPWWTHSGCQGWDTVITR